MTQMTTSSSHAMALQDIFRCSYCKSRMTYNGGSYVCPNNGNESGVRCPVGPADAARLTRRVVSKMITRVMDESNTLQVISDIQNTAAQFSRLQRERLDAAESMLMDLNRERDLLLQPVEQKLKNFKDVASQVDEINAKATGASYEALVAREELDKLAFISDADGIKAAAQDPATYLDFADPSDTIALINLFVDRVEVGVQSAKIVYAEAASDGSSSAKPAADCIDIN